MKIGIASDHRGVYLKGRLIEYLEHAGYEVVNYGNDIEDGVDYYPEFAKKLALGIKDGTVEKGIAICGTGIGMSIALNKFKGVYCAKISSINEAVLCREHNNANAVAISADTDLELAISMITKFIITPFSKGERHIKRNQMIKDIEEEND